MASDTELSPDLIDIMRRLLAGKTVLAIFCYAKCMSKIKAYEH